MHDPTVREHRVGADGVALNDVDVIVVGAGPTGLMLAAELGLAGVRTVVLERQSQPRDIPKANGFSGQILELLRYRGLLDRFEAADAGPTRPAAAIPFGGVQVDLDGLAESPLKVLGLPQPRLERVLGERAREMGAEVRRGCELVGLSQDDVSVTAQVCGPEGLHRIEAAFLVGCDGSRSRVRSLSGIGFPGITYPEVNRIAEAAVPESVTLLDSGDLEVPGLGRLQRGFTRTEHGVFAFGALRRGSLLLQTTEDGGEELDDEKPMTLAELHDSIRRVLGGDLPLGEVTRLSRYTFQARQADRYRVGRIFVAGDAAHQFPATGIGINIGMSDAVNLAWKLAADVHGWAPAGLLDSYDGERRLASARALQHTQAQVALRRGQDPAAVALRELFAEIVHDEQPARRLAALIAGTDVRYPGIGEHALVGSFVPDLTLRTAQDVSSVAELLRAARPVLLDLAGRSDLRSAAQPWQSRIDIHTAVAEHRPADALLIRPDAYVAWAASTEQAGAAAVAELREAMSSWFGAP